MGTLETAVGGADAGIDAVGARIVDGGIAAGTPFRPVGEIVVRPPPSSDVVALVRTRIWGLLVWSAVLAWSVGLLILLRDEYANFQYLRFDLGDMTQAVWSTAHGHPLEMTSPAGDQLSRLAFHVDPVLIFLAPFWLVAPSPLTLASVQVVFAAIGALPVFWLGRRHLGSERTAALLAIAYLVYPWTLWTALDAMHPVTLAMPLLLFAIWFLDNDRLVPFAACAVVIALSGELMGMEIAALGIWYWLSHRRGTGLAIAGAGLGWSAFAVKAVVPFFAGGPSVYYSHFESIGGSPGGVLTTAFTHPWSIASALTSSGDIAYWTLLVAPLALTPLLAPGLTAVALPLVLVNGLSERSSFIDPRARYSSVLVAVLFGATVFGVAQLRPNRRFAAALLVLALCAATTALFGLPGARYGSSLSSDASAARVDALRSAISLVPANAPVSATNAAGSHLSARRYFYSAPVLKRAEWVVIELQDAAVPGTPVGSWAPRRIRQFAASLRASSNWELVFERNGVLVFRRGDSEAMPPAVNAAAATRLLR